MLMHRLILSLIAAFAICGVGHAQVIDHITMPTTIGNTTASNQIFNYDVSGNSFNADTFATAWCSSAGTLDGKTANNIYVSANDIASGGLAPSGNTSSDNLI